MKKQSEQQEQLAHHAQLVEDQLYDQLTKYSKAYSEIAYSELLPLVYNEPYITDLPSLQHKIRDLAIQNRIKVKMFLDHLKFGTHEEKSKSDKKNKKSKSKDKDSEKVEELNLIWKNKISNFTINLYQPESRDSG